ncbi:MAG TPA: calcium/sodium antiporter [Methanomicrobia archaeon]|nr:calcium/sodium antiporter [Methanomicrobia archaeon]
MGHIIEGVDIMLVELALIAIGFILLVKGADYLVKGASFVARSFGVSYFVIGLTVVALGTSMPEFVVNVISAIEGSTDIGVGNILGSNMANILLIVGLTSLVLPMEVNYSAKKRDIPLALFSAVLLIVLAGTSYFFDRCDLCIGRIEGIMLLSAFVIFLVGVLARSREGVIDELEVEEYITQRKAAIYLAAGLVGLYYGGVLIVDNAVSLATQYGLSEILISSTIVAFGTSLPELATSLVAAYKRNTDIAIGNVVGSNIFNILWVLGFTGVITPIHLETSLFVDMGLVIIATSVLLVMSHVGREESIDRPKGLILLVFYLLYLMMLVARG